MSRNKLSGTGLRCLKLVELLYYPTGVIIMGLIYLCDTPHDLNFCFRITTNILMKSKI
jgi:hypothetical protein